MSENSNISGTNPLVLEMLCVKVVISCRTKASRNLLHTGFKLCYCPESSEPVIAVAGAPELSDMQG